MATNKVVAERIDPKTRLVFAVFFVSGMSALLYQLAWQRVLFTTYGTNSESITAIVAAFMFGLGLGSLAGGRLSHRVKRRIRLFALVELATGLYGVASVPLLHAVGTATAGVSTFVGMALSFALVVAPTILMGATLPLLVQHFVANDAPVGRTVGELYYVNTLGSSFVCVLATLFLFGTLGLSGTVYLAALLNIGIAVVIWLAFREEER